MRRRLNVAFIICALYTLGQDVRAGTVYDVNLDTAPLVGHPAGPFYLEFALTDGSGIGDANNTVTLGAFDFGGGSDLGGPLAFGGVSGSLETGVAMTDNSFLNLFYEPFAPGLKLSFSLDLTSIDDASGVPDRFTFFVLDSSGVPLPTLAAFGDFFFGADIYSTGPILDMYGSDPSRSPTSGGPVSIAAPTITPVSSIPEPGGLGMSAGLLALASCLCRRRSGIRA